MKQINLRCPSLKDPGDYFWSKAIWLLVIICSLLVVLLSARVISVAKRNNLKRKINVLERQLISSNSQYYRVKELKKDIINYKKRISKLRSLFKENCQIQRFFHELSRMALKQGYFIEIDKKKDLLRIKGVVWQQREIMALYSKMTKIDFFRETRIVSIKTNEKNKDGEKTSDFVIEAKIRDNTWE